MGGEDREWALYFMKRGYKIIHDPKFKVRHSHHLKIKDFFWQLKNWYRMANKNLKNIPEIQRKNF